MNREFSKIQMTNKYFNKCSASLAMREMKIKATLRFYLTQVKEAIIQKTNDSKCCQMMGKVEPLFTGGVN